MRVASVFAKNHRYLPEKKRKNTLLTSFYTLQHHENRKYLREENEIAVTYKLISVEFSLLFRERNDTWALARAKANVVRWYPVVGVLDYMEESLNALALEFPYFFKGAARIYEQFRECLPYTCKTLL